MSDDQQSARRNALWWLAWLAATILLPAWTGGLVGGRAISSQMATLLLVIALALHLASSIRLDTARSGLTLYLILGGWPAMAAAFFGGCGARIGLF